MKSQISNETSVITWGAEHILVVDVDAANLRDIDEAAILGMEVNGWNPIVGLVSCHAASGAC